MVWLKREGVGEGEGGGEGIGYIFLFERMGIFYKFFLNSWGGEGRGRNK